MFYESLECFQTSIIIYEKLLMYGHISFALGDYMLSKLILYIEQIKLNQQNSQSTPRKLELADEENTNEELYKEILLSSQNRYSQ